jgi:autotransporter-associated beta strand protein
MKTDVIPSSTRLIFPSTATNLVRGLFAAVLGAFALCAIAQAADVIKANNTDNLELTTSWVGGALPGANTATWNSTVTSGNTTSTLGTNLSFGGIKIVNPGAAVTVNAAVLNSGSVTANSTTDTFTYTGTDVVLDNVVTFGGTTVPIGLTKTRPYFIVNVNTGAKTYQISDTPGGTAINFTSNGTAVTNNATTALTIGSTGIALSTATQNLYLTAPVSMSATHAWTVATGRVLNNQSNTNTGGINVLNNGYSLTVDVAGTGQTNINNFVGTGGLTKNGTGTLLMLGAASSYSGNVVLNDGTLILSPNSATTLGTGTLTLNGGTLMGRTSSGQNYGSNTTVGGNAIFYNTNSGANGGGNYTLGTLSIGANTFTVTHNTLGAAGSLTFGATTLTGNATFDVSTRTDNSLILGAIGESGGARGFTKNGVGMLSINGTSTFTGTATVSAGTMILTGTGSVNSSSGVSVASGATFTNSSSVAFNKALSLAEGAILNGAGVTGAEFTPTAMTITADLTGGAYTTFALGATGLTKAGNMEFTLSGITAGSYEIFSGSALSGTFSTMKIGGVSLGSLGGGNFGGTVAGFTYSFLDSTNTLGITAVPEPATWALLAFSLTTVMVLRRRRKD